MKILKRVLLALGVLLLLVGGGLAALVVPLFSNLVEMPAEAELAPGVRQVKDGYVSAFLLDGGNGQLALIDCGNDEQATAILASLKSHNFTAEQVTAIFLTHGHPDHTGGCKRFPKAEIYAFPQDVLLASGQEAAKGLLTHLAKAPESKRIKVSKLLQDGQEVQVGNLTVRALATPGHTGGSASFLVNGVLVLGDNAAGKKDGVHVAPGPFTDDAKQNRQSLENLYQHLKAEGGVKTLAFSHSGPVQGIEALAHPKD